MTPATLTPPPASSTGPKPYRWSAAEFHDLSDQGRFEGKRVILLRGEILQLLAPNPHHDTGMILAAEVLTAVFRPGYVVRNQMALELSLDTDPVPDLAFVPGSARDYSNRQPNKAVLVVEIADTTFDYDITIKAELYATGGIPDCWVLDVTGGRLHVFRDPALLPASLGATAYRTHLNLGPGDTISPLAVPTATVTIADLLP